jgi:RimJ/RimL family protein N-acetyltransferase
MPEAPDEVLEVPHCLLSRTRESDADQLADAVGASLDHLRRWLSWATEAAADVQAQRRRCREAEAHWAYGYEYSYVLRPGQSEQVIGGFDLWRIGPNAVELGYWVHVEFTGRGYATACARALTQAGLSLSDVARVEIHTDEANVFSAAIPRRLGYRLDRVDELPPEAPAHSGRVQIWVIERPRQLGTRTHRCEARWAGRLRMVRSFHDRRNSRQRSPSDRRRPRRLFSAVRSCSASTSKGLKRRMGGDHQRAAGLDAGRLGRSPCFGVPTTSPNRRAVTDASEPACARLQLSVLSRGQQSTALRAR